MAATVALLAATVGVRDGWGRQIGRSLLHSQVALEHLLNATQAV